MTVILPILAVQVLSFVALGLCFLLAGNWRLGVAQLLLGMVQLVIYSGGVSV